jgi:hypothetical protein
MKSPASKSSKASKATKPVKVGKGKTAVAVGTIPVSVLVTYVGTGGNVGNGQYQYSCDPDAVHVEAADTVISYRMNPHTTTNFVFTGLYSTDSMYYPQLSEAEIAADGRTMDVVHSNEVATLIDVALQIHDNDASMRLSCDPQITNNPGVGSYRGTPPLKEKGKVKIKDKAKAKKK